MIDGITQRTLSEGCLFLLHMTVFVLSLLRREEEYSSSGAWVPGFQRPTTLPTPPGTFVMLVLRFPV